MPTCSSIRARPPLLHTRRPLASARASRQHHRQLAPTAPRGHGSRLRQRLLRRAAPQPGLREARLAAWNHPNLPGRPRAVGRPPPRGAARSAAPSSSRVAPRSPSPSRSGPPPATLYFLSDRTGWWNLYRWRKEQVGPAHLPPMEAEFAGPHWRFAQSTYAFESETLPRRLHLLSRHCAWHLAHLDVEKGTLPSRQIPTPLIAQLRADRGHAISSWAPAPRIPPPSSGWISQERQDAGAARRPRAHRGCWLTSLKPEAHHLPDGQTALSSRPRALLPPRATATSASPRTSAPPLIVISHGGPTFFRRQPHRLRYGEAVLDQPRLWRAGCELRGQHWLWARVSQSAVWPWGVVDVDGLRERGEVFGHDGRCGRREVNHLRRQRGRLHDTGRPGLQRHL